MGTCFVEVRTPVIRSSESGVVDIMRHLRTRQHLGKAVIICERPETLLAASRKQWMKLARAIQKQRAMTLNADKLLKHTHAIINMQGMRFTSETPLKNPEGDVYFLKPGELEVIPPHCFSVYLQTNVPPTTLKVLLEQLPAEALIIDYIQTVNWGKIGVRSKEVLEAQVAAEWRQLRQFLAAREIDINTLRTGRQHHIEAMDNALDSLLEVPHKFLRIANDFQHALELARPLRTSSELRQRYDALMLLAHRVQTLTMPAFSQQFLESYSEDDTFFLYDTARERFIGSGETPAELFTRHQRAGRERLAHALLKRLQRPLLKP
jgi:hypothetical protein